jgi:hypothetical protein
MVARGGERSSTPSASSELGDSADVCCRVAGFGQSGDAAEAPPHRVRRGFAFQAGGRSLDGPLSDATEEQFDKSEIIPLKVGA